MPMPIRKRLRRIIHRFAREVTGDRWCLLGGPAAGRLDPRHVAQPAAAVAGSLLVVWAAVRLLKPPAETGANEPGIDAGPRLHFFW